MSPEHLQRIVALVGAYGYPLLFAVSAIENTFLLGLVIPGDAVAVVAGAVAAKGPLSFVPTYLSVMLGVTAGALVSFGIGRRGGMPLVSRWGARNEATRARLLLLEQHFATHGPKTVMVGCFMSGIKNLVPAVAGASKMGIGTFSLVALLANAARSLLLVGLGYTFGKNVEDAIRVFQKADRVFLVLLVGLGLLGWVFIRHRRGRARGDR